MQRASWTYLHWFMLSVKLKSFNFANAFCLKVPWVDSEGAVGCWGSNGDGCGKVWLTLELVPECLLLEAPDWRLHEQWKKLTFIIFILFKLRSDLNMCYGDNQRNATHPSPRLGRLFRRRLPTCGWIWTCCRVGWLQGGSLWTWTLRNFFTLSIFQQSKTFSRKIWRD